MAVMYYQRECLDIENNVNSLDISKSYSQLVPMTTGGGGWKNVDWSAAYCMTDSSPVARKTTQSQTGSSFFAPLAEAKRKCLVETVGYWHKCSTAAQWKVMLDIPNLSPFWNQNLSCTGWCLLHHQLMIMLTTTEVLTRTDKQINLPEEMGQS